MSASIQAIADIASTCSGISVRDEMADALHAGSVPKPSKLDYIVVIVGLFVVIVTFFCFLLFLQEDETCSTITNSARTPQGCLAN